MKEHMSLYGKTSLATPLADFTETAKTNFERCAPLIIKQEDYKLTPIFVSKQEKDEYEKIENWEKKEIEQKVMKIMKTLEEK